jgi:hypothetical protein
VDPREMKCLEAGENCMMRSCIICTLHQYYYTNKIQEDEKDGSCSTLGGDEN